MAKVAEVLEIPATVTERAKRLSPPRFANAESRQTGHVVFKGMADGTVVIAKRRTLTRLKTVTPLSRIPYLSRSGYGRPPATHSVLPASLLDRARDLVDGVEVDLDAPLPDDDR